MSRLSVETEYDKIIKNLALSKASCLFKINNRICKKEDCSYCKTCSRQNAVYSNLSIADQLAVDNHVELLLSLMLNDKQEPAVSYAIKMLFKLLGVAFVGYILFNVVIMLSVVLR